MTTIEPEKQRNLTENWINLVSGCYKVRYEEVKNILEIELPDGEVRRYGTSSLYAMQFAQKLLEIQHINEDLASLLKHTSITI